MNELFTNLLKCFKNIFRKIVVLMSQSISHPKVQLSSKLQEVEQLKLEIINRNQRNRLLTTSNIQLLIDKAA